MQITIDYKYDTERNNPSSSCYELNILNGRIWWTGKLLNHSNNQTIHLKQMIKESSSLQKFNFHINAETARRIVLKNILDVQSNIWVKHI